MDSSKFHIVAGLDLVDTLEAEKRAQVPQTAGGYFESETLCRLQSKQSGRGILGAEIVTSNYGCSVRYDSGLMNFGLLASAKRGDIDGSVEDAERWAREWVAQDPTRRYAWRRIPRAA